jgi:glycosyltransferase involved in cell wall biosynthesis
MLAGLPVVATRVGSVAEAVSARETGLLVPPDDPGALAIALRELVDDPGP